MQFHWKDRQSHWAELRTRLEASRTIFPSGGRGETCRALFDEFLENREFGLALDVLCDFLLEPDVPPPSETDFKEIAVLHTLMEVQNDCVLRPRDKRQNCQSADETL
jgi:hypothetical protein